MLIFRRPSVEPGANDPAPEFDLPDQQGERHSLSRYRGQWLVLYFYPRDDTPGCTAEACSFRDAFAALKRMGVAVVGVSLDDVESHRKFASKYRLGFPLLFDRGGDVARAYGALFRLGPLRFARRHTFLIDPGGRIARIYRRVDPGRHSEQLIGDLGTLLGRPQPAP
jgi:peroxiredoxin Q/BCP